MNDMPMKWTSMIACFMLLAISFSCKDECDEQETPDCIAETLKRGNLERYHGQELECRTYLTLYMLQEQKFFMYGNACQDRTFSAFDCEGNEFCDPVTLDCTTYFSEHATNLGIIGIAKE